MLNCRICVKRLFSAAASGRSHFSSNSSQGCPGGRRLLYEIAISQTHLRDVYALTEVAFPLTKLISLFGGLLLKALSKGLDGGSER
jgi:hypothetical protein